MSELTFAATRFMKSLRDFIIPHWDDKLSQREGAPQERAADVSSAELSIFCRQDAGSTLRFLESLDLQDRTRIGVMNLVLVPGPSSSIFRVTDGFEDEGRG
jgi:hypothetical protein